MRETFVTEDLLNTLIMLEIRGNENYIRLEASAPDPKSREMFGILATQELKHKKIYEGFRDKLPETETADAEYVAYAALLLKKHVPLISGQQTPQNFEEGFQLAVELEKQTIFFLHEVKELLLPEQRSEVDPLIAEERKHLQYLLDFN